VEVVVTVVDGPGTVVAVVLVVEPLAGGTMVSVNAPLPPLNPSTKM